MSNPVRMPVRVGAPRRSRALLVLIGAVALISFCAGFTLGCAWAFVSTAFLGR